MRRLCGLFTVKNAVNVTFIHRNRLINRHGQRIVRALHESGTYGELETGNTVLAFSKHSLMQQFGKNPQAASPTAPCFEIALCTPDVAAAPT